MDEKRDVIVPEDMVLFSDADAIAIYAYIKLLGRFDYDMIKTGFELQPEIIEAILLDLIAGGYLGVNIRK